ncbi:MAG: adenylate kinase [Parcubacteria group bacterium Athens0714_16]|nr:MAG: adenylate kinase [Parcubacteria group bacterium Athens0714_16]
MTNITKSETFIFIGPSGCGKGTQAELLIKYLKENDPSRGVFYLETGEKIRSFMAGDKYSNKLSKQLYEDGKLQPEFLAVWVWADILIGNLKDDEHLVVDGTPRKLREAKVFDTAIRFYERTSTNIIFLNVSHGWSKQRLEERGRLDDKVQGDIERRLDWYEKEVVPTIEYFKTDPNYKFYEINGEQSIDEVHNQVIKKIFK